MSSVEKSEIESDPAPPSPQRRKRGVPEGLWIGCDGCKQTVYRQRVEEYGETCPECGHHFYISARKRIQLLLDADSFEEWFDNLAPKDPLGFVDKRPYAERLAEEQARTGMREACIAGRGYLRGRPLVFGITDSAFIMGSMGSVVGEKLTRAIEAATELHLPLVVVSASGGGADARRHFVADADGEGLGGLGPLPARGGSLYFRADESDNGWSGRQLRLAGRRCAGRTAGADRFCRAARRCVHRENLASEGIPDERVSVGARLYRSDRQAGRTRQGDCAPESTIARCEQT